MTGDPTEKTAFGVSGNITVKETGEGIPGLTVALFDIDRAGLDLDHLEKAAVEGALADRIGSVLTDTDGRFEMSFNASEFQLGDQERRPDLMLVVFSPEDSRSVDEPSPLMPEDRILHISRVPRQDAGHTEAYAIRLLKAQLERFEIRVGPHAASAPEGYVASIEAAWAFQDVVKTKLQARFRKEVQSRESLVEEATEKFKHLSAAPLQLRQRDPLFVATPVELPNAQSTAIEKGLERLSRYDGVLELRLSESDIERLNAANGEGEDQ